MTGVAAQMCGNREEIMSLGYQIKSDGTILQEEIGEDGKKVWKQFSKLGARKTVLNDLSPAATFIAYNYNMPVDAKTFERDAKRILVDVEEECGWMYETLHTDGKTKGKINYTIWSDVFLCSECAGEIVFWDVAVDKDAGKVRDKFPCPHCQAELTKRKLDRSWTTKYDSALQETIRQTKQTPVLINYSIDGHKGRYEKVPDEFDFSLITKTESTEIPYWFPNDKMMFMEGKWGDTWRAGVHSGITNVHHFYTRRNAYVFSASLNKLPSYGKWIVSGCLQRGSKQHQIAITRIGGPKAGVGGATAGHRRGTLYIPSNQVEMSPFSLMKDRINALKKAITPVQKDANAIMTASLSNELGIRPESMDYLFFDPPFGANIMYSELNFLWESWTQVWTNNKKEAIENSFQKKNVDDYRKLMTDCFKSAFLLLKPGRWMTVEFSNTKASIWNSIQTSLFDAGFIIANISALDKKRGGLNAIITPTAVKQDLVISAYKPNGGFEERFKQEAQTEEGIWDFIRTHLKYLPITKKLGLDLVAIPERDPRILYDQMIAYYVRKGYNVPIDSQDFQLGLSQRFSERDGMYFLPEQVAEYDRKKMLGGGRPLQQSLFVSDEASAIEWLRSLLRDKPQSFQDINPLFMKEIGGWSKNEVGLELSTLLEQNFLPYDGKGPVPDQIHSYLSTNWKDMRNLTKNDPALVAKAKGRWYVPDPNKAGDLEKLREKALLKEFEEYKQAKKKLKIFRLEAVRAGFKKAWQERDYKVIITVAEKIPNNVLEEDPKLLMWYDQAVTRTGASD
jgi:hypothetical protein